ncbi:YciI family protein [Streptomyces sp. URMC 123]|uniref:YciI family protein n=1 Tax=Streptomyces sp. URMC 123 TaxID=3423403 RepID=UPI003F1A8710
MKYMLLLWGNRTSWDALGVGATDGPTWPEKDAQAVFDFMNGINQELTDSGELVDGQGLADPTHTRTVRVKDGSVVVTDGPFSEAKEVLAGYYVVECESLDRATEIAVRIQQCPLPEGVDADPVEVRPIMEGC